MRRAAFIAGLGLAGIVFFFLFLAPQLSGIGFPRSCPKQNPLAGARRVTKAARGDKGLRAEGDGRDGGAARGAARPAATRALGARAQTAPYHWTVAEAVLTAVESK
jgi:hypothetical protein